MFEFKLEGFNIPGYEHIIRTPNPPDRSINGIIPISRTKDYREPFYMKQVHGGTVHLITEKDFIPQRGAFGDGVFTNISRLPLMIFTADCIPLIIVSDNPRFIGVIHASWRSISLGIIENAVVLSIGDLNSEPSVFRCFMGPGILGEDYEVGYDVAERFPNSITSRGNNKYLLDLPVAIRERLVKLGVRPECIIPPPLSTFRENWLPSYRRDGDSTARIETVVWLE